MFKVGDMVTVRHHSQQEKDLYPFVWMHAMHKMEGRTYRISYVVSDYYANQYLIDDGNRLYPFLETSLRATYEQF